MQPGGGNSQTQWVENLEHLRAQLEEQVTVLQQKKQQLRVTLQDDVESASVQVQNQYHLLDNLRYEGEVLTEKLMKLRSSRQDTEAELFVLKDKRIRLLEDISKLEDEEMQLVSEVNAIMYHKRNVLKEIPFFETRARASASLAVVQDYLLASVQHLTELQDSGSVSAGATSWSGLDTPQRPSEAWIKMPPPAATVPSLKTAADEVSSEKDTDCPSKTGTSAAGSGGGGVFSSDQLLRMQQIDAGSAGSEGLPTLHEGQPFPSADLSGVIIQDSVEPDARGQTAASRHNSSFASADVARGAAAVSRHGQRDPGGSWSSFSSGSARGSDSVRSAGSARSISTAGVAGSGSFSSAGGSQSRQSSDGRGEAAGPVAAMALSETIPHASSSRDMWMMPGAGLVLQQADSSAADKQGVQSLQGMLAVQQHMQGMASGATAAEARQLFVQHASSEQLGGSGGSGGAAGSLGGGGSVVLLTSADPAVQYLPPPQGHPGHQ
eukprot:gene10290-10449_t